MYYKNIKLIVAIITLLLGAILSCSNDLPQYFEKATIKVVTSSTTSITLSIENTNNFNVQTFCDISPNRSTSSPGWHSIAVPDLSANSMLNHEIKHLASDWTYRFRCRLSHTGFPGRTGNYGDSILGNTIK